MRTNRLSLAIADFVEDCMDDVTVLVAYRISGLSITDPGALRQTAVSFPSSFWSPSRRVAPVPFVPECPSCHSWLRPVSASRRRTATLDSGTQRRLSSFHRSVPAPSPKNVSSDAPRPHRGPLRPSKRPSPKQPRVPHWSPSVPIDTKITDDFQSASPGTSRKRRCHNIEALRVRWRALCSTTVRPGPSLPCNSRNSSISACTHSC